MVPLCKLVKRGVVQANDLSFNNDVKVWPDSSAGRAFDVQCQGLQVQISSGWLLSHTFTFH